MPVVSEQELARRRSDILEGARHCFARYGYEGATVRRLEQETGKSRGAIFHHFADKESLFLAIASKDAVRQAEVVSRNGLVEVMRDILAHPDRHDWLATRLEITRMLRTDAGFRARWQKHQEVLDDAVRARLENNASQGMLRDDVPVDVLMLYLETVMDGMITRLASGMHAEHFDRVLDMVEASVRPARPR